MKEEGSRIKKTTNLVRVEMDLMGSTHLLGANNSDFGSLTISLFGNIQGAWEFMSTSREYVFVKIQPKYKMP